MQVVILQYLLVHILQRLEVKVVIHLLGLVPNRILEKPGKLTDEEFNIIKEHPYYTRLILKDVEGFAISQKAKLKKAVQKSLLQELSKGVMKQFLNMLLSQ